MSNKVCNILVGVPGAGKSTWINQQPDDETSQLVSTDMVIDDIAERYGLSYDECFKDLIGFAEKIMWMDMEMYAKGGLPIYIDRTNLSIKSRKKFIDFLKPYGYRIEAVVFPTPNNEEWERRLKLREGKTIPNHVLESMVRNYQAPTLNEGFFCITTV